MCTIPAEKEVPDSVGRMFQPLFVHATLIPGAQIIAAELRGYLCDHEASAPLLSTVPTTISGRDGRPGNLDGDANTAGTVSTSKLRSP